MTLDALEGERCAWCANQFEPYRTQKYCSKACYKAHHYEEFNGWRARVRAVLKCQCCGADIPDAKRRDRKYCAPCQYQQTLIRARECDARKKAAKRAAR